MNFNIKHTQGFFEIAVIAAIALFAGVGLIALNSTAKDPIVSQPEPTIAPDRPKVSMYIEPKTKTLKSKGDFTLKLDPKGSKIGFIKTIVTFDKTKLRLTKDVVLSNTLSNIIKVDKFRDVNKTGKLEIVIGLAPGVQPPSDIFSVGKLTFEPVNNKAKGSTTIDFVKADVQVVAADALAVGVDFVGSQVLVN